jgi:hypothetical protein
MNEEPKTMPEPPDLAAAIRQARLENAERAEAVGDLRELELGRLAVIESALKPVIAQAPPEVDMFDLAIAPGDHPRLFLDMIAFVDLAHDRRTYRFYQDTRLGRALLAESQSAEKIAAAAAQYVARRLVERERALAADQREAETRDAADRGPRVWSIPRAERHEPRSLSVAPEPESGAGEPWSPPRRRFIGRIGEALNLLLTLLGAVTLALLLGLGVYLAWTFRLRDAWMHWFGAPLF